MAITHSFENAYTIVDYTEELMLVPNMWNLVEQEGIFSSEGVGTNVVVFDKTETTAQVVVDKPYGERSTFGGNEQTGLYSYAIPTFPLDDDITVGDVYGLRKVGTADMRESVENVVAKKVTQIRRSHAITSEYARCQAIQGLVYAPNGTIPTTNWYTEFGQTQTTVNFDFANTAIDQRANVQTVVAHIQDSFHSGGVLEEIIFFCTPNWFAALISNAQIEAAYTYYSSTQEPLRNDLRFGMYRRFTWQGVTFIEYRGAKPDGTPYFPEVTGGQAWALPRGSDSFMTYYAPAYRFDAIGSDGAESYMWTYEDQRQSVIEIQSESNFLCMSKRPELVVLCTNT
ncbi:MAG: hypothetical protein GY804_00245 [Alphaproteobacteria bacterium]|nr:hypothetical protein [Alphaproteobacteria bacterium]